MPYILVVDDDASVRQMLQEVLKDECYEVDTAPNGAVALEKLRGATYDLMLLNVWMPHMGGRCCLQQIRQQNLCPTMPIIILTSDDSAEESVIELGIAGFLMKPFDLGELISLIAANLSDNQLEKMEEKYDDISRNNIYNE